MRTDAPQDAARQTGIRNVALQALPVSVVTIISIFFLDEQISAFISSKTRGDSPWSPLAANLPDLLLVIVITISTAAFLLYKIRKYKRLFDMRSFLLKSLAVSLPASFLAKSLLKNLFGRVETRVWLENPQLSGFHWFSAASPYNGFPSGHMAVFATLFASIWRCHPKLKPLLWSLLFLLGFLLLASNYHFLSDIICGGYLGIVVESIMFTFLKQQYQAVQGANSSKEQT